MKAPRIVIGAGGTAGHVVPALAVADALRAEGAEVTFVGGERAELELVPAAGYELHTMRVVPLPRGHPVKAAAGGAGRRRRRPGGAADRQASCGPPRCSAPAATWPDPVGLAAVLSRVPLVLTEADSHLGLTNRLLAPFARRVCLAFPIEGRDGPRYVRHRPAGPGSGDRLAGRAGPVRDRPGRDVRARVRRLPGRPLDQPRRDRGVRRARASACCTPPASATCGDLHAPGPHYDLRGYISDFGEALLASDLVVARAGGSIFEIAAHGRPAVLVPYPYATADHQTANARFMERAGAAVVIPDTELTGARLAHEVGGLLADRGRLAAMARASAAVARPDAARDIAHEVLAAARKG